jgi:hypothetical protein
MFLEQIFGAVGIVTVGGLVNPIVALAGEEQQVKLPSGTSYVVLKSGDGPQPSVGELAGIRFRAEVAQTGNKIDDIFDTPEPYYTRIGSGGLLKVRFVFVLVVSCFYFLFSIRRVSNTHVLIICILSINCHQITNELTQTHTNREWRKCFLECALGIDISLQYR